MTVTLTIVQRFDASPEALADAIVDPALPAYLAEHHEMFERAEPVMHVDRGEVVERAVRWQPRPTVRRIGTRTIPQDALAFEERSTFDRRTMRFSFESRSLRPRFRERVVHRGTATLKPCANGTERHIEATLEVREIPFALRALSPLAARMFRAEAERLFEGEARCLRAFLRRD